MSILIHLIELSIVAALLFGVVCVLALAIKESDERPSGLCAGCDEHTDWDHTNGAFRRLCGGCEYDKAYAEGWAE